MRYLILLLAALPSIFAQTILPLSLNPSQQSAYASADNVLRKSMATDPGWSSVNSVVSSELARLFPTLPTGRIPQTVLNNIFSDRPDVQSYYVSLQSLQAGILDSITATATATDTATVSTSSIAPLTSPTATMSSMSSTSTVAGTSVTNLITPTSTQNAVEARATGLGMVGYAAVVGVVGAGAALL